MCITAISQVRLRRRINVKVPGKNAIRVEEKNKKNTNKKTALIRVHMRWY
jgi:hypothetical protein